MSRVLVTGSADGLGHRAASTLLVDGHDVVVHVRSRARLSAVQGLVDRGATALVADLADAEQTRRLAEEVAGLGDTDAVIHNAGVYTGATILPVNVVAPYLLTALLPDPGRLVYLSSGMHRGGRATLEGLDWSGRRETASYSDSKLLLTALSMAVARRRPDVAVNAVDPGWVPTKMGGAGAPDDLELGHRTQEWLAVAHDAARTTGGYWFHREREEPHPAVHDEALQAALLDALVDVTGVRLTA